MMLRRFLVLSLVFTFIFPSFIFASESKMRHLGEEVGQILLSEPQLVSGYRSKTLSIEQLELLAQKSPRLRKVLDQAKLVIYEQVSDPRSKIATSWRRSWIGLAGAVTAAGVVAVAVPPLLNSLLAQTAVRATEPQGLEILVHPVPEVEVVTWEPQRPSSKESWDIAFDKGFDHELSLLFLLSESSPISPHIREEILVKAIDDVFARAAKLNPDSPEEKVSLKDFRVPVEWNEKTYYPNVGPYFAEAIDNIGMFSMNNGIHHWFDRETQVLLLNKFVRAISGDPIAAMMCSGSRVELAPTLGSCSVRAARTAIGALSYEVLEAIQVEYSKTHPPIANPHMVQPREFTVEVKPKKSDPVEPVTSDHLEQGNNNGYMVTAGLLSIGLVAFGLVRNLVITSTKSKKLQDSNWLAFAQGVLASLKSQDTPPAEVAKVRVVLLSMLPSKQATALCGQALAETEQMQEEEGSPRAAMTRK